MAENEGKSIARINICERPQFFLATGRLVVTDTLRQEFKAASAECMNVTSWTKPDVLLSDDEKKELAFVMMRRWMRFAGQL